MARLQTTQRQTRKGSKKLMDDDRAAQIARFSATLPHWVSAAQISKYAAPHANMTNEEKEAEIASVRKKLGILPRKWPDV